MNILIFNWQDIKNPLAGGAEVHLHEIFSRVAMRGHSVTLFCTSFPGAAPEEMIDGIRVIRNGGRYLFNLNVIARYLTYFRKGEFDVVVDDMNKIPFFTPLYVCKPLVLIVHHLFASSIFREVSLPLALYVSLTERLGVTVSRWKRVFTMVVSESTKAELIDRGFRSEDMQLVYNCVDHEIHRRGGAPRSVTPLVGYFGRLKKYKSADHLLRAFILAKEQVPDLSLVIIGEGDHRPSLEALARRLEISKDVHFTGFVSEAEKVRWLQQMWFMVNTSSKEGWGLTVIEANACGTTVIGSDVPGLRDAIKNGKTGLLYEYGNINELAEKMVLLANDHALRERLSETAYEWAETFDWGLMAERTIDILQRRIREDC